jgi:hypothetical protein
MKRRVVVYANCVAVHKLLKINCIKARKRLVSPQMMMIDDREAVIMHPVNL